MIASLQPQIASFRGVALTPPAAQGRHNPYRAQSGSPSRGPCRRRIACASRGGGGGGTLSDAPHSQEHDGAPSHFDVLVCLARLRGSDGLFGQVPRPANACVAVLQAPLPAALPHTHRYRGREGGGAGAWAAPRFAAPWYSGGVGWG